MVTVKDLIAKVILILCPCMGGMPALGCDTDANEDITADESILGLDDPAYIGRTARCSRSVLPWSSSWPRSEEIREPCIKKGNTSDEI